MDGFLLAARIHAGVRVDRPGPVSAPAGVDNCPVATVPQQVLPPKQADPAVQYCSSVFFLLFEGTWRNRKTRKELEFNMIHICI